VNGPQPPRLVLDEMFSPKIAAALRERGYDVVAVAERLDLRSMTDDELFAWSVVDNRWPLTENVKDFRPILLQAMQAGAVVTGVLFTSSRTFPRSRLKPGPLIAAVHRWLATGPPPRPLTEDWLPDPDPARTAGSAQSAGSADDRRE